jgi:hypothetical protein
VTNLPCHYAGDTIAKFIVTDEAAWWQQLGLDPAGAARALWLETHPQGLS